MISHIGALPVPLAVANVQRVFDRNGRCLDPKTEVYIRRAGVQLLDYLEQHVCPRVTLERVMREGVL